MTNYKTVPNQKVITVNKQPTNKAKKENYYATINLDALNAAACKLDAGAFKLWVYFAKNQDGFEFALSSKAVETTFGMKIRQYNSAVQELIEKKYLVNTKGNNYVFNEKPVNTKDNNDVDTKCNNDVDTKCNNPLLQNDIRNITDTTLDNTINNIDEIELLSASLQASSISLSEGPGEKEIQKPKLVSAKDAIQIYGSAAVLNAIPTKEPNCFWISGELVKVY
ncbi:MAG: hypothetical protein IKT27_03030 [Clostridia bacterium]|nr:hypothetical protein [Clostridia bacterium]